MVFIIVLGDTGREGPIVPIDSMARWLDGSMARSELHRERMPCVALMLMDPSLRGERCLTVEKLVSSLVSMCSGTGWSILKPTAWVG